jgi:hypothetical protein
MHLLAFVFPRHKNTTPVSDNWVEEAGFPTVVPLSDPSTVTGILLHVLRRW